MKISIVTAVYKSAAYVHQFHERHLAAVEKLGCEYEFIFVNDASPDESLVEIQKLIEKHPGIKVLSLSRNFGQHAAMFAGLAAATGDLVYATDCDLEEAPENLIPMVQLLQAKRDVHVVYGVQKTRAGGMLRVASGNIFYWILDKLSSVRIPKNQVWQRVMTKQYVQALLLYREVESLPAGLMTLAGFSQIPFEMEKKYKGGSSYTLIKRIELALNSVLSFSSRPLVIIASFGFFITTMSFLSILVVIFRKLSNFEYQAGWVSLIVSMWFLCGTILLSIGILGIYISKIFIQVKQRPIYIVQSTFESKK